MTSRTMASVSRAFCFSDLPGQSLTITCGIASSSSVSIRAGHVLLVGHFLHPIDRLAVQPLLYRDVRHGCCRGRAVPVLLTGLEPDHVSRPNAFDRPAPALSHPIPRCHEKRLSERVGVPGRPSARLKGDA